MFSEEEIASFQSTHNDAPHQRFLQKKIAEDITHRVHGEQALKQAINASKILFGKSTKKDLMSLSDQDFLAVFNGVPQANIKLEDISNGISIVDALVLKDEVKPKAKAKKPATKAKKIKK